MNDEHIQALTGWVIGDEILEYIKRIENENSRLVKEREHLTRVINGVIPILTDISKNSHFYSAMNIKCKIEHLIDWLRWYK